MTRFETKFFGYSDITHEIKFEAKVITFEINQRLFNSDN